MNAFLTHLAVDLQVSASTQNQALSALLFLYRELLERDLDLEGVVRQTLEGDPALVVGLLYGSGLRLMEALRLRVQDLDFERRKLTVRDGKGGKDRRTLLPQSQCEPLKEHLQHVRRLHQQNLAAGWGAVILPNALTRKYPHADREWGWQWVFPQRNRWKGSATGKEGRHHLDSSLVQKAVKQAVRRERGQDIRTIQELMGHSDLNTTMINTHMLKRGPLGVISPLQFLKDGVHEIRHDWSQIIPGDSEGLCLTTTLL